MSEKPDANVACGAWTQTLCVADHRTCLDVQDDLSKGDAIMLIELNREQYALVSGGDIFVDFGAGIGGFVGAELGGSLGAGVGAAVGGAMGAFLSDSWNSVWADRNSDLMNFMRGG